MNKMLGGDRTVIGEILNQAGDIEGYIVESSAGDVAYLTCDELNDLKVLNDEKEKTNK